MMERDAPVREPGAMLQSLLLVTTLAATVFLLLFPMQDYDTFWHLAYGRAMVESGQLINHEIYSYTAAGVPLGSHSQLAQVLLYLIYRAAGANGLIVFKCLCGIGAVLLVFGTARRCGAGPAGAATLVLLLLVAGLDRFVERPELFSILALALLVYLLFGYSRGAVGERGLWMLPPLFAAWEYLHGSIYGMLLLGTFVGAETGKALLAARNPGWFSAGPVLSRPRLRALWIWSGVTLAVLLLHPNGLLHYEGFWRVTTHAADFAMYGEFASPGFNRQYFGYWLFLGLTALLALAALRHVDCTALLVVLPFAALSLKYGRANLSFCLVAVPLVAQALARIDVLIANRSRRASASLAMTMFALVLCGAIVFKLFFVIDNFRFGTGLNQDVFPVGSMRFVRAAELSGNLYNMDGFGGYLAYHLGPERKIFHYNQPVVFTALTDFVHKPETRSRWDIRYAIIGKPEEYDMFTREGFIPVYWEPNGMVLVRPGSEMQPVIDRYRLKYFQPLLDNDELRRRAARPWATERLLEEMANYLAFREDQRVAGLFAEIFRTQATTVSAQQRTALTDLALRGNPGNPELLTLRSVGAAGISRKP